VTVIVPTGQCGQGLLFSGFINRILSCSIAHRYVPYSYRSPLVYRQQQLFFLYLITRYVPPTDNYTT